MSELWKQCKQEMCRSTKMCCWESACDVQKKPMLSAHVLGPRPTAPGPKREEILAQAAKRQQKGVMTWRTPKFDDVVKVFVESGLKVKVTRQPVVNSQYALCKSEAKLADGTIVAWSELTRSGNELIRVNRDTKPDVELPHKNSIVY